MIVGEASEFLSTVLKKTEGPAMVENNRQHPRIKTLHETFMKMINTNIFSAQLPVQIH
jgi:hypothetical protein